ncbi:Multidrug resistance [Pyrenophora seminiperda CCB06]|uniref:Multidrug resistance n=1 Tax=Pyrenophora seminiperda CCB06 TaxID=1302712 RepID=A0A3M7MET8_9PLEO|nr:Multidrug resistance [Pyrenophora seminiperda CCB06]
MTRLKNNMAHSLPFRMLPSPPLAIQIPRFISSLLNTAGRRANTSPQRLQALPSELVKLIVAYLDTRTLKHVALVSRTLNQHATDVLWQDVCLSDQWKLHVNANARTDHIWGDHHGQGVADEHDDTPIIQKLYILATNPTIASKVHVVTHRCHLPMPNVYNDLPRMNFDAETLSQDARIHVLAKLALRNLVNVHTLRIIYGHWKLTNTLVAGFLDESRPRRVPLRRLWLESCCFDESSLYWLLPSQTTGLESIRLRRLESATFAIIPRQRLNSMQYKLSRSGHLVQMHNGAGGFITTTAQIAPDGLPEQFARPTTQEMVDMGKVLDAAMWEELSEIEKYIDANPINLSARISEVPPLDSRPLAEWVISCSASTLTSLNLDWIHWRKRWDTHHVDSSSYCFLALLSGLRFPQLRAFQIRNAIMPLTRLPDDIYLLEGIFLGFLEAHTKLQCLAWPMDRIYSHTKPSVEVQSRSRKLVAHLATMLTDLRIDAPYMTNNMSRGEPLTDDCATTEAIQQRIRRHRFIAEFAPHMRKLEQIKVEGGIPRDEKRELLRALHWCSLKKIVMIGVSFPVGNTWGAGAQRLKEVDPGQSASEIIYHNLEEEDGPGMLAAYRRRFPVPTDFDFRPNYGWSPQAPLLQTIALHHASTVEELKLCGYNGCPILSYPNAITTPLLSGLRSFDNLKQLVLSLWLVTWYEDSYRDTEIIQSWLDVRSPSSTALVVITPPASPAHDQAVDPGQFPAFANPHDAPRPQEFNRWAVALKTRFSPSALAYRVARDIGPFLSPLAKERKGGVRVRGSICLGINEERRIANDIFDLDIRVGKGNQVLEFVGPREEGEKGRWWSKLEQRRWF